MKFDAPANRASRAAALRHLSKIGAKASQSLSCSLPDNIGRIIINIDAETLWSTTSALFLLRR